jgi:hypothetical protein
MKEAEIVHTALENLKNYVGIKATWENMSGEQYDGIIKLTVDKTPIRFEVEIKSELREHQLAPIVTKLKAIKNMMICATRIYPKVKEVLRENNIAWLEGNGNIYFNAEGKMVWVETQKPLLTQKEKLNRAFTRMGLQVVFQLLNNQALIEENYRVIADKTGTALGNVSNVFNGLKASGFIVMKNKKEKALINKKELLDKWLTAYQDVLKPAINLGKFRFTDQESYLNWKNLKLNTPLTQWGGEPAAETLTDYLRPAEYIIYTTEPKPELMKKYRLLPDENGDVVVYKKFWIGDQEESNLVPPLLVYADLMLKNEKRCQETARLIYERFLEKQF